MCRVAHHLSKKKEYCKKIKFRDAFSLNFVIMKVACEIGAQERIIRGRDRRVTANKRMSEYLEGL